MRNTKNRIFVALLMLSLAGGASRAADQVIVDSPLEPMTPEACGAIVLGVFAVNDVPGAPPRTVQGVTLPIVDPGSRAAPVYPEAARQTGVQGKVQVQAVVCKDGSVQGVQVLKSPSPELGTAAADAVRLWKFQPAVKDGKPVAVRYTVTLDVKP